MAPLSPARVARTGALTVALAWLLGLAACSGPVWRPGGQPDQRQASDASDASPSRQLARLRLALATAYYQQGQDEVAMDALKQALASDPDLVPALNLRGLVHLRLGQWSQAQSSLQRALELAPQDADVAHNLAWTLCQHPQAQVPHEEVAALFQRALAQPDYAHAARSWAALGLCQQRVQRLPQAQASLTQAWLLAPDHLSFALLLAQLHADRGQWLEASQVLVQAHLRTPATAQSLWLAARAARKLDNQALFRQWAEQLRQEFGRSPQALALDKGLFDE